MDTAQWPQGIGVVQLPMEIGNNNDSEADHQRNNKPIISAPRPQKTKAINCPRCNSTHTKFCYYNNYSLTQPRYFCKTCRRYWTEGGSLRNVPVGGTLRKNKRSSSSSSLTSKKLPDQNPNIKIFHQGTQDLNLAYPPTNSSYNPTRGLEFPNSTTTTTTTSHNNFSSGINGGRGFSSFMSMINPVSDSDTTGFLYSSLTSGSGPPPFQEFSKTSSGLNFSLNHQVFDNSGGYGTSLQGENDCTNHAKLLNFPFEDFKQPAIATITSTTHELLKQNQGNDHLQSSGLIWNNGGLGGGGDSW